MTTPPDTEPTGDPYADVPHTADLPPTMADPAIREDTDTPLNVPAPPTLPAAALAGTAGRIVGALAPHTEADPAALLALPGGECSNGCARPLHVGRDWVVWVAG